MLYAACDFLEHILVLWNAALRTLKSLKNYNPCFFFNWSSSKPLKTAQELDCLNTSNNFIVQRHEIKIVKMDIAWNISSVNYCFIYFYNRSELAFAVDWWYRTSKLICYVFGKKILENVFAEIDLKFSMVYRNRRNSNWKRQTQNWTFFYFCTEIICLSLLFSFSALSLGSFVVNPFCMQRIALHCSSFADYSLHIFLVCPNAFPLRFLAIFISSATNSLFSTAIQPEHNAYYKHFLYQFWAAISNQEAAIDKTK